MLTSVCVHRLQVGRADASSGPFEADLIVNCAGLHSDRLATTAGAGSGSRIVPFRGEYLTIGPAHAHLVRGLIYPSPTLGFLPGVHLTRMIDGSIHIGPNAVLAGAREG